MEAADMTGDDQPGAAATPAMETAVQQRSEQQGENSTDERQQQLPAVSTVDNSVLTSPDSDSPALTLSASQHQPASISTPSLAPVPIVTPPKLTPAHFKPSALLGEGSYSQVYLVQCLADQQQYAMKVLNKAHLQRHNRTTVAYAEKAALSHCHHPNIIRLYHTFQDHASLYFILELCDGGDVASLMDERDEGGLPHQLVVYYAAQLLHCLHYLHHTAHIIHRDIKPDNLMLSATGQLKLVDFGTAKLLDIQQHHTASASSSTGTSHTAQPSSSAPTSLSHPPEQPNPKKHSFVGTAAYVAPEILTSTQPHSYAVDQWSAGATLYQLMTGRLPFHAASEYLTFQRILGGGSVDWLDGEGGGGGRELVGRLMERDESRRLGVAAEDWEEVKRMRLFEGVDWERLDEWRVVLPRQPGAGKKYSVMSEESLVGWRNSFSTMAGEEAKDSGEARLQAPTASSDHAEAGRGEHIHDVMLDSYRGSRLSVQQEGRESQSTEIGQTDSSKQERKDAHSHSQPSQYSASGGYYSSAPPSSFQSHLQPGETLTLCSAVRQAGRSSPFACCFPWLSSSSTATTSSASHLLLTSNGHLLLVNLTTGECLSRRYLAAVPSVQCAPQPRQPAAAGAVCDVLMVGSERWQLLDGAKSVDWVHAWQQAGSAATGSNQAAGKS